MAERQTKGKTALQTLIASGAFIPASELVDFAVPTEKLVSWAERFQATGSITSDVIAQAVPVAPIELPEAEVSKAQSKRFAIIEDLVKGVFRGTTRSLFLCGGAGMGKSYLVQETLSDLDPDGEDINWFFVSGKIGATGLFTAAYEARERHQVLVVDDADGFLKDETALNLVKALTDTKRHRRVTWGSEYKFIDKSGQSIPKSFEFSGSIIIITNKNLTELAKGGANQEHLEAIVDRAAVVTVDIETQRDRVIRLREVARTANLFQEAGLTVEQEEEVLSFIDQNRHAMNRISFRTALKVANYRKNYADNWQELARLTEFQKGL